MEALTDTDPAQVGAHALLARLGAGALGPVYLARSPGGRLVAVQVVGSQTTGDPEALARFKREAEAVRAVRSAHTADLVDASLAAPPFWLATEYAAGPTLARAVAGRGPLPAPTCRRLLAALAEGLAALHAHGVAHREFTPECVVLAAQGPQITGSGLARGAGAPGFAAPEVRAGAEAGPAADVFALGAVLAYAATGRPPLGAVGGPLDVAGVEPGLAALVAACTEEDPARRPHPAEVVERCAAEGALAGDPVYAGMGALGDAVPRAAVRAQGPAPAGAYGYPPPAGWVPPAPAAAGPSSGRRRGRAGAWAAAGLALAALGAVAVWRIPAGGGSAAAAADAAAGSQPAARPSAGPPVLIRQTAPNPDSWDPVRGECRGPEVEERPLTGLQGAVTPAEQDPEGELRPGRVRIAFRLEEAVPGAPAYHVAVVVKPPHEVDAQGRSTGVSDNRQLGFVALARDVHEGDATQWKSVVYPDDFSMEWDGRRVPAPAPAQDPGGWTVVFRHAVSDTEHKSVWCRGFDVGAQKG
ncbi:serine/threonine protein kinase [Streptomyces globosus]|uniref:Serine/threonine protein kinase n=1 Tax=Streptomyces globosus TaxID=68209 RepID=A0A344U7V7_9ACTN|nr:protein kinase [Streptomyces globosus]AXE26978.1 serine/threonine protein kinase [Streptomyces globosus]